MRNDTPFNNIKDKLIERIKLIKVTLTKTFESSENNLYKGSRWNSNENIFGVFCDKLAIEQGPGNMERDYEKAYSFFLTLPQYEIDLKIIDAAIESAKTDYFYKYEKDY